MRVLRRLCLLLGALVVIGSLPVTLSRWLGWTTDPGIVLTAFTPFGVVSYAVALGLATLAVLTRGRRRDGPAVLLAAVATVLAVVHLVWVAPLVTGDVPDEVAGSDRWVVLSVNAQFGRADAARVVEVVRERDVDLLVVTEITPRFVAAAEAAGLDELLPKRAGRPGETVAGTMVFAQQPVRTVDRVETTFGSLVVEVGGLTVLAAHPAPPQSPDDWRRDQPLLLEAAQEHGVDAIVGDLNATLDHPTIRDLVDAGWRDAVELTNGGFAPTWPAHGEHGFPVPAVQIDHVLVSDLVRVVDVESFELPDTDHLAVLATLATTPIPDAS